MRLIDADAFEANMQNEWERNEISNGEWIHFREMINNEPTIEAVPERKGRWVNNDIDPEAWNFCSVCGEQAIDLFDYCPNCGAHMGGEQDDND